MNPTLDTVGQIYRDFLVTKYLPLPELQSTLIELVHETSGARVMHIANDDPENLFCLSLQTLPNSSSGVAHILEHIVLCGSKKFPIKDPFFAMTRRSLNTFMNALTGQDFTCYPASSQVEKDFYNLLEVYLDAVFAPELKKLSFLQEGHRLQLSDPTDLDSPLQFQGVVFNEMKGAMSAIESRLWEAVAKHLLPNLPYAYNSGGNPKEIPHLSYEELLDFHRTFYHPSRCLFFFYGNLPLAKHLDFILQNTLHHTQKLAPIPPLPLQPRFSLPIHATDLYPISAEESREDKTQIAFCWLTAPIIHQSEVLSLCLIECMLMETDASPLKMALLKSGLCQEAESSLDIEMSEIPMMIVCKGCKLEAEDKLKKVLFGTLEKFIAKPIDPVLLEGAIHQLELQRMEIGGEGGPFGLTLFMRAGLIKQHGGESEDGLLVHSLFQDLRERLKDPHYLPGLIRKHLLENSHFLTQILLPDPKLEKREQDEELERLEEIRLRLTSKEKEHLVQQAKELAAYQEAAEHQSIDCLPKVTLSDIPKKARDYPLHHFSTPHLDVFHHDCFTNQIIYADLLFDLPHFPVEDLPLISLLTHIWTDLGCVRMSYEETLQFMQSHTGGIDAHLAPHVMTSDPNLLKPAFSLRGKALARKAEPFFQLLYEFAQGPDLSDTARIREWLLQHASELDNELASRAINYAVQESLSSLSEASFIYNQWNGLPYYRLVKQLAKDKKGTWIKKLDVLAKQLVSAAKPHLILSCSKKEFEGLKAHNFYQLGTWKSARHALPWKGNYPIAPGSSRIYTLPSPVAFTALGMRTSAYKDEGVAELMISTQLFENLVLHKEIREKGGAYGASANYMPTTGNFHFYAYRDPRLSETLDTFQKAIEYIGQGHFNERELDEAKIGLVAGMDTPVVPGGRAIVAYAWLRAGRTLADRQKLREEILAADKEQVCRAIQEKLQGLRSIFVSFMGTEMWEREKGKLKEPVDLRTAGDL